MKKLTAQEIKSGMSKGIWHIKPNESNWIESDENIERVSLDDSIPGHEYDAAAICSAVNNTYGINVNPDSISEMVAFIQTMADMHSDGNPTDRIVKAQQLIRSIKINP